LVALCATTAAAVGPTTQPLPPQLPQAVDRGLAYLGRQQQPDGSFTNFEDPNPRQRTASLTLLAMLAAGQTPTDGRQALVVRNAIGFLLRETGNTDGYFGQADGSGMTGQALITMALAEAYGVERDPARRAAFAPLLRDGLAATLSMQDRRNVPDAGGWNEQGDGEGTLAVTAVTVLSLKALRGAGLDVPADVFRRAAAFARSREVKGTPEFAEKGEAPNGASTAAGACILLLTRSARSEEIDGALQFLVNHPPASDSTDYMTTAYYAILADVLADDPNWAKHWDPVWDNLRRAQADDGSWLPIQAENPSAGAVTPTAGAVLTLTIPYRLLPVYGGK
jgi:hypothetical protein